MVKPDYEGSDDYEVSPLPLDNISYEDRVFLDGPSLWSVPRGATELPSPISSSRRK